ncbi:succinylglutamate desuccinylase/aspartoacylase family protein [Maribacter sp. MMG018]|uniref:M14 family metallopeptidase n=1 Tax=Maribacter sp. MMG018 TaxID=2822688 RepID=UPI001B35A5F0|nr:M14 family metallopeptidase [Maribacter sp. MMG018]MBQ4912858.1 succinylglutamate desuccinylase/aspartoacylase family protein [Maribacter sp. MMG018]
MSKALLSLLFFFTANIIVSQNSFESIYTASARPHKENIQIYFNDSEGNSGYLPISIVKGANEGPVFTIIAGVHGFEYPPIVATQKLMAEIDIKALTGTLIIIPVANTASFFTRTPFINPQDQKNLNNAFPGKVDGTITEQIAHYITTNIIPVSDVLLDVHGGDACEDLIPFVCYYDNKQKPDQTALAKKLSENSGFELVVSYGYSLSDTEPAKYTFKQAVQDGKTALSIECGKLGNVQEENVDLILKAIHNMLAEMNMYNNGSGPHENIIYGTDQVYINAGVQGIFYSDYKAGDKVKKDAIVGYTTDEFGKVLEEYKSPKDGTILYKLATPPINIDDTVMCITSIKENE